ncbi:hypothetical protein MNBD_GAMMA04-736 [hydrothermal vent metagenome]|uniref:Type II secretion system protein L n=1 Tax=hydrothermal vent metagenome TaxID=652676 RepID=A0A3B0VRJ3_9ZZZZ
MRNKQTTLPLEATTLALNNLTVYFNLAEELVIEDAKGVVLETAESLAQLSRQGNLKSVLATVWVPSQLVVLTEVFVPGKSKSDWMAALPYTLEESLSEPVEQLHFVPLQRTKEGMVSVAIVAHQWMEKWVATLQSLGLMHVQLVPNCFRVPVADAPEQGSETPDDAVLIWNVVAEGGELHIRSGAYSGFSVSEPCLEPFIHATEQGGAKVSLNHLSTNNQLNSQLDDNQSISKLTLRTDAYQAVSKNLKYWQDWRWPALLVGLLIITALVATWQKTQTLGEQTQQYQAQTESLFKEMFPGVKRIVNIKMQTQSRLNNQQGGGQKNTTSLVTLLQAIEPLFKAEPNVKINRLQWNVTSQGGQLQIDVSAQQTQQLQNMVSMSQQQKRTARLMDIELELKNVTPNLVEGVLHVTAK